MREKQIILNKEAVEMSKMIQNRKENYFHELSLKLNNRQISFKTYWSVTKLCYSDWTVPIILPLSVNREIVTNFKGKVNLFNKYFVSI